MESQVADRRKEELDKRKLLLKQGVAKKKMTQVGCKEKAIVEIRKEEDRTVDEKLTM